MLLFRNEVPQVEKNKLDGRVVGRELHSQVVDEVVEEGEEGIQEELSMIRVEGFQLSL